MPSPASAPARNASAAGVRSLPPRPGQRVAHFVVHQLLGQGGMGWVFEATDERLQRKVALKVLLPELAADPTNRERFLREARAAASLTHDHVVTVHEVGQGDGLAFLTMPLLPGVSLERSVNATGLPGTAEVLRIGRETAEGLAAAHATGLIHRDIKPGNIWLEAPAGRVKILDFGLAVPAAAADRLTRTGIVVGTPAYMSPEQACGAAVDARTDLFSLGVVLYELCTGRSPFAAAYFAAPAARAANTPPPIRASHPHVPPPVADLVSRLLAHDPADRYPSAADVVRAIQAIECGTPASAEPADRPGRTDVLSVTPRGRRAAPGPKSGKRSKQKRLSTRRAKRRARRLRWLAGAAALVGIGLTAGAAGYALHGRSDTPAASAKSPPRDETFRGGPPPWDPMGEGLPGGPAFPPPRFPPPNGKGPAGRAEKQPPPSPDEW